MLSLDSRLIMCSTPITCKAFYISRYYTNITLSTMLRTRRAPVFHFFFKTCKKGETFQGPTCSSISSISNQMGRNKKSSRKRNSGHRHHLQSQTTPAERYKTEDRHTCEATVQQPSRWSVYALSPGKGKTIIKLFFFLPVL